MDRPLPREDVSRIHVAAEDPAHRDARCCIAAYFSELAHRDSRFDPALSLPADDDDLRTPAGVLLLARHPDGPVGCVALKLHDGAPGEVKRMWVSPSARGLGVGRRLLTEVEQYARARGVHTLRLETNRTLSEAIGLYLSAGFLEVPPFNDEPFAHHWFEKDLRSNRQ